CQQYYGTPYSC
nr:immunoglobulin light chain junction region [Macaca mulatta]